MTDAGQGRDPETLERDAFGILGVGLVCFAVTVTAILLRASGVL